MKYILPKQRYRILFHEITGKKKMTEKTILLDGTGGKEDKGDILKDMFYNPDKYEFKKLKEYWNNKDDRKPIWFKSGRVDRHA